MKKICFNIIKKCTSCRITLGLGSFEIKKLQKKEESLKYAAFW